MMERRFRALAAALALGFATLSGAAYAEIECPARPNNYGIAVGLAKSCNIIKAPVEDVVAAMAGLEWTCQQSQLRSLLNGIREGANYDRYDNHWQLCSEVDQYRPTFEKIDDLTQRRMSQ